MDKLMVSNTAARASERIKSLSRELNIVSHELDVHRTYMDVFKRLNGNVMGSSDNGLWELQKDLEFIAYEAETQHRTENMVKPSTKRPDPSEGITGNGTIAGIERRAESMFEAMEQGHHL